MDVITHNNRQILAKIIKAKDDRGLSDEAWAEFLGVSWSGWSQFKNGKRRITNNFLVKLAAKCPEIQLDVFQYMRQEGGD